MQSQTVTDIKHTSAGLVGADVM